MKIKAQVFALIASSLLLFGCATSPRNINARYDVSQRITPPVTAKASEPTIILGIVSLKGSHESGDHEDFVRDFVSGKFSGAATFTPQIPLRNAFERGWEQWREVDVPVGFTVTNAGSKEHVATRTGKTLYGVAFNIGPFGNNETVVNVRCTVPTWEEVHPFSGVKVAETLSMHTGFPIDLSHKGWQVVYLRRDYNETRPGTDAVLAWIE